ncbi:MAG: cell division protein SepF [Eubacterium sp.]|nr:cell division protein SepF [Eubacterium sp.]
MGFLDKVKDIISENDDEEFDDYYDDAESFAPSSRSSYREREREITPPSTSYEREERPAERPLRRQKNDKVVNIHTTAQLQVVLVKPERYEEAAAIADNLNERRTVVLNLESTNRDVARRLLDFLSGVAYANNGQIKRVANSTYIITPYNVDVMGDLIDELENNGMFM